MCDIYTSNIVKTNKNMVFSNLGKLPALDTSKMY